MARTNETPSEVLTVFEAAKLLQVSGKTLWQQAKSGKVPHFKIGKQYRFNRMELLAWARSFQSDGQSAQSQSSL